jgi:hypothetical protein
MPSAPEGSDGLAAAGLPPHGEHHFRRRGRPMLRSRRCHSRIRSSQAPRGTAGLRISNEL